MIALALFMLVLSALATPARPTTPPPNYTHAIAAVPPRHWALVRFVAFDRTENGQAHRSDMSIHLTPTMSDGELWHEVGHIVAYSDPDLERAWHEQFWPDGRPRYGTVSRYARTNEREDFAESYMEYIEHGRLGDQPERDRFMRTRVFFGGAR